MAGVEMVLQLPYTQGSFRRVEALRIRSLVTTGSEQPEVALNLSGASCAKSPTSQLGSMANLGKRTRGRRRSSRHCCENQWCKTWVEHFHRHEEMSLWCLVEQE